MFFTTKEKIEIDILQNILKVQKTNKVTLALSNLISTPEAS